MPTPEIRREFSLPQKQLIDGLDEVAKGLASGSVSRRKALRLMGGVFVGTVLGSVPGVAWAQTTTEATLRGACRNASACCACTYKDATGEVIQSICSTLVARSCESSRVRNFFAECQQACEANAPTGANLEENVACEERRHKRDVCTTQRTTGQKTCDLRSC